MDITCSSVGVLVRRAFSSLSHSNDVSSIFLNTSPEVVCQELEKALEFYSFFDKWSNGNNKCYIASDSPIAVSLIELALDCSTTDFVSPFVHEKIHYLVSIPNHVANQLCKLGCRSNYFDRELYFSKLCDIACLFILLEPKDEENTFNLESHDLGLHQINTVACLLIEAMVKNGTIIYFFDRLECFFVQEGKLNDYVFHQLIVVTASVFQAALQSNFACSRARVKRATEYVDKSWSILLRRFVRFTTLRPSLVRYFETFFVELMDVASWAVPDTSHGTVRQKFSAVFVKSLFVDVTLNYRVSRHELKYIFNCLAFLLKDKCGLLQDIKNSFNDVLSMWGCKKWVETCDIQTDAALMSTVIHILLFYEKIQEPLAPQCLSCVLDGVSLRLGNSRLLQFREHGMTVAAAYASTAVEKDAAQALLDSEEFNRLWKRWLEADDAVMIPRNDGLENGEKAPISECPLSVNTKISSDPDKPFFFFARSAVVEERGSDVDGTSHTLQISEIPSFGLTKREEDHLESNVEVLHTLKQSYNALAGIGRMPNAQLIDIQRDIESGLRGLHSFFYNVQENTKLREEAQNELGALCPTLLHVLISAAIHAPEKKRKELLSLRYFGTVQCIELCPQIALFTLSNLLYSSSYGITQRADIARAIGDAATQLANSKNDVSEKSNENVLSLKRIYPPIPDKEKRVPRSVTIGRNTRRWGYAAHRQSGSTTKTTNQLAEVASFFVQALIARHDDDHFKFFQDFDPYTPAEILRSLIKIFQGVGNVRHVAPFLCLENIDFFLLVLTANTDSSVQKFGWIAFEEVMRCWCGAPPHYYVFEDSIAINKVPHCGTLAFSEEWLASLNKAMKIGELFVKKSDMSTSIIIEVLSTLRDLVKREEDLSTIMNKANCGIIAL